MVIRGVLLFLAVMMLMACSGRGIVYSNTIKPYSKTFQNTPVGKKVVFINTQTIKTPPFLGAPGLGGEWDADEIMRLAREAGITELRHIDVKTLSFLLGTYRRQTLIVYGD